MDRPAPISPPSNGRVAPTPSTFLKPDTPPVHHSFRPLPKPPPTTTTITTSPTHFIKISHLPRSSIISTQLRAPIHGCPTHLPLLLLLTSATATTPTGFVGINYGRIADDLPSPADTVKLLQSQNITAAKIYDADPAILSAFSHSGISLVVSLPNDLLPSAASHPSFAYSWLSSSILPFYPSTNITSIAVGNEVFTSPTLTPFHLPALTNLYSSLKLRHLHRSIKLSSPLALSALNSSFPPSAGAFAPHLPLKPLLHFLRKTSSFLMLNAYPFLAYSADASQIPLTYALLQNNSGVVDSGTGLLYSNLFDAQVDAVLAAMSALQCGDIPVVVTETGWPSMGDSDEAGATAENAAAYNGNLVRRVLTGGGTPLRPNQPLEVYLFALFNENQKPGPTSERNFGLFYPDRRRVYDIPLTVAELNAGGGAAANTHEVVTV